MRLSLISISVIITSLIFLLFFSAFVLLWIGQIGPVSPSLSAVVVFVQDQEYYPLTQPVRVKVKKGEPVEVKVQVYYQEQLKEPGEFTYQWCFNPPINENRLCSIIGYRGEVNQDYRPQSSAKQALTITVQHNFLRTSTITLLFEPE